MPEERRAGKIAPRSAPRENPAGNGLGTDPRSRVVLLGASNLTLSFPHVIGRLRAGPRGPLDVLAAIGHGRSYGRSSSVLFRELPGIVECGLWRDLDARPELETLALLSDLGNDLVYGAEVDEIAGWIARILDRLATRRARTILVRLPLASIDRLSPLRFRIARAVLYPSHRVDLAVLRARARALDERMAALAAEHGAGLVDQREEWYGLDPVHIRTRLRGEAWNALLAPLAGEALATGSAILEAAERRAIRRIRPERRRWMGREQRRAQPCAHLLDGTAISVY